MARNTTTSQYLSASITLPTAFTLFLRLSSPQTSSTAIAFETHSGSTSVFSLTSGELRFYRAFSTTQGRWSAGTPTWSSENWIAIRHDGTTAAPTIRLNGSNRTVTQTQAPSGTATATAATAYVLNGNAGTNPWGGTSKYGRDLVIYNRVLSDSECDSLGSGQLIQSGLTYGWQIAGTASPEPTFAGGTTLTVTGATFASDPATVLGAPAQVTGLTATPSGTTMALSWTALADAQTYKVDRSLDGTTWTNLIVNNATTSYSDTGLASGTYYYRVAGNNQLGTGTYSSSASGVIGGGGGSGSWHITTATRPLIDRIKRATVAATSGEGFLSLSTDNSTWSYFAGPATGTVLTAVASLAAAQAAPVTLPTDGYWDLPSITEARVIRLHHRSNGTSPYTIYEYYPRRIVQSDDIEAEAIKAIHIAAGAITADMINGLTITGITVTGSTILAGGGTVTLDTSGIVLAPPAVVSGNTAPAINSVTWKSSGVVRGGIAGGASPSTTEITTQVHAQPANPLTSRVELYAAADTSGNNTWLRIGSAGNGYGSFQAGSGGKFSFFSNADITGGLNVGTATGASTGAIKASAFVDVGNFGQTNVRYMCKGAGTTAATFAFYSVDSSNVTTFYVRDDGAGYLKAASWTYGSDERLKRNVKAYDKAKIKPEHLKAIAVKSFDYIDGATNQVGYVAQDIQAVIPEAVTEGPDGTLGVRSLEPWMILWLQQHQQQLDAQQQQIDTLTQQVQALQSAVDKLMKGKP